MSKVERAERELVQRIQTALERLAVVPVLSGKGGVGKTTSTVALGAMLANMRSDNILAMDANPDGGSLSVRVPQSTINGETIHQLRDLLTVRTPTPVEFDRFVNKAGHHRLHSIVGPLSGHNDPLTGTDFSMIVQALRRYYGYKIALVDCGTDMTAPVMDGIMDEAEQIIIASSTVMDEAAVVAATLETLKASGFDKQARNAITIIATKNPDDNDREGQQIIQYFRNHTAGVVTVPYDSEIRKGGEFDLSRLSSNTYLAYQNAAAETVQNLSHLEHNM